MNPNQPIYSEELSQFLKAQAALLDAQPAQARALPINAITPMPPEFQLQHPRRIRWSGRFKQSNGDMPHFSGFSNATPEEEAWHRINAPEHGLDHEDLTAYRASQNTNQSVNERARRLGPDWNLNARNLAWVSNYRDWDDVFRDVWSFFCKPLRLLKRWLG